MPRPRSSPTAGMPSPPIPRPFVFPWAQEKMKSKKATRIEKDGEHTRISLYDRIIINGKYGKWWELGHHANPSKPDEMYMDEHAVRIRAGILNIVTWIALINIFFWKIPTVSITSFQEAKSSV